MEDTSRFPILGHAPLPFQGQKPPLAAASGKSNPTIYTLKL